MTVLALACALSAPPIDVQAQQVVEAGRFAHLSPGDKLPPGWEALTFRNIETLTRYSLATDAGVTVLKAESSKSASGLIRRFDSGKVNLRETPILRWRWKVSNLLKGADIMSRQGDDYPARVYVTFHYDAERAGAGMRMQYAMAKALYGEYPPHAGINYVWDGKAPAGTMLPNAYTARAMMFVVESGPSRVGEWVAVERNVYEDYKRAFKEEPPPVSGIAVMTDTDQTGESATAWYGDIELRAPR